MAKSGKKISNTLVTLSSAAILAVYAAGYEHTKPAAERIVAQAEHRRFTPALPIPSPSPNAIAVPPTATPALPKPTSPVPPVKFEVQQARVVEAVPAVRQAEMPAASPTVETPTAAIPPAAVAEPQPTLVVAAPAPEIAPDKPVWKDGVYLGWGYSRHGDIQAFVRIENGRIIAAGIEKCQTRYSCSIIDPLPPQVLSRQSPDVDYISGATQSADAFYGGIFEALKKASQ